MAVRQFWPSSFWPFLQVDRDLAECRLSWSGFVLVMFAQQVCCVVFAVLRNLPIIFLRTEVSISQPAISFALCPPRGRERCAPPVLNVVSPLSISPSFGPPGQHMEPSKLVLNFPAAVVKTAALTAAALRELIRNPRA